MKTETHFIDELTRIDFDFGPCSYKNNFAQIDTTEDASWYGQWCNPVELRIVVYAEGDITHHLCATPDEFCEELRRISAWHLQHHGRAARIDPGLNAGFRQRFVDLGLADLLH